MTRARRCGTPCLVPRSTPRRRCTPRPGSAPSARPEGAAAAAPAPAASVCWCTTRSAPEEDHGRPDRILARPSDRRRCVPRRRAGRRSPVGCDRGQDVQLVRCERLRSYARARGSPRRRTGQPKATIAVSLDPDLAEHVLPDQRLRTGPAVAARRDAAGGRPGCPPGSPGSGSARRIVSGSRAHGSIGTSACGEVADQGDRVESGRRRDRRTGSGTRTHLERPARAAPSPSGCVAAGVPRSCEPAPRASP